MAETIVKEIEAKDTIEIGGKVYALDEVTPSVYFDYVKSLKQTINYDEYDRVIDAALGMMKKCKVTGQTEMAKLLSHEVELAIRELDAAKAGFDIYVMRADIERYIEKISDKSVKIIELSRYEREIPDDILDRVEKAQGIFDELYVIFTDYSLKETKKVAKERRDRDPILFGAFRNEQLSDIKHDEIYVEDRFFFIVDWVEENCDLTFEQLVRASKRKYKKDITYRMAVPEDEEKVKNFIRSFTEKVKEDDTMDRVNLFGRAKKAVKKAVSSRKKKKEDDAS